MASGREPFTPPQTPARILVCDDAPSLRAMMAAVLGRTYSVLLTATAEEALQRAPGFAPDLVITDHILPGISGRDLVGRLRANPAFEDVPIILLTAVSDAEARAEGIEAGADEYLVKPVRERELRARVASLLRLRQTLLALSRRSRELEDANAALREAQGRLVRSERLAALGTLAASLAHDINNPLAIIASGAATLRAITAEAATRPAAPEPDRFGPLMNELSVVSDEVFEASQRMQEIGRDLRLFGSATDAPGRVPLEDAIRSAVSLACARCKQPPLVTVESRDALEVDAPSHLVTLAFLAIIDRAVVAAGPTGHVRIDLAAREGGAEVVVHDDGARIPVDVLPRVFEPFVRLNPAHETAGLGLSVAAGIVHGLGGQIDVDGERQAGACFTVRLPLAASDGEAR